MNCGCIATSAGIFYCPLHAAAEEMFALVKGMQSCLCSRSIAIAAQALIEKLEPK